MNVRPLSELNLPDLKLHAPSPLVREVDERSRELARRLGLLRGDTKAVRHFGRAEFGLLSALAYVSRDPDILTACNDFGIYLFFLDDRVEEDDRYALRPDMLEYYFDAHVLALRRGQLAWDEDPAARLLADLHTRFRAMASEAWLERFADDVHEYLHRGTLEGARCYAKGVVPSVDAYLEHRDFDSAVFCAQDLLELSTSGELPPEVLYDADFKETRRLCARVVAITNDLVSYPKEVQRNASPNNLVHVLMTHEHLSLAEAIDRVFDMINADVAAFEAHASQVLSRGEENHRDAITRFSHGQRAWMRANLEWSLRTGRYRDPNSPFPELRETTECTTGDILWVA